MTTQDLHQIRQQGRKAFLAHGVTGAKQHDHAPHSHEHYAFREGFDQEQSKAAEHALRDAAAYHALSVRDNAKDRAWTAKLSA